VTTQAEPLVSVVVTTYNQGRYIHQTLASVFGQTFADFEVVVVDDGSTDDTPSQLQPFRNKIVYIRQDNQGIASSRNTGIRNANGRLIALLDGDDLWEPEKLAIQLETAQRFPAAGLIVVNGVEFDEHGVLRASLLDRELLAFPDGRGASDSKCEYSSASCYRLFVMGNRINTVSQVMIPKPVLESVGLSDAALPIASDYDLYLRILKDYPIAVVNKSLTRWRYVASSASGPREVRPLRWLDDEIRVLTKLLNATEKEDRALVRNRIRMTSISLGGALYCYGLNDSGRRAWASWGLMGLLLRRKVPVRVIIAYLGALWLPQKWVNAARRRLRKALRVTQ
jgi:glycosyltransferase involved in cell wall biosynthesis